MNTIGQVASVLGILGFLVLMNQKVTEALKAINAPASLNFYFLFFWAFVCVLIGGLGWAVCQRFLSPPIQTLGGAREPHGLAAFLWPIITNIPLILLFAFMMRRHNLLPGNTVARLACVFLVGLVLSSLLFYDLPLFGQRGFRGWLGAKEWKYAYLELVLVFVWSIILSAIPFSLVYSASKLGWWSLVPIWGVVEAVAFTVGITSLTVAFFVAAYPSQAFESARGILAGLALHVSLFFGLILTMPRRKA